MKRVMHILNYFAVLTIMVACSQPTKVEAPEPVEGPTLVLSQIDSLMWRQPDSALAQLQAFCNSPEADSLDEFNGHYCPVLVAELLYKNYYKQSNRKELMKAVHYFDSIVGMDGADAYGKADTRGVSVQEREAFLAARAHYINGMGYYERDSLIEACQEYLNTLRMMESHFAEGEMVDKKARFMALTYNRLMELFSAQFMQEPAIYCGKQGLIYTRIAPTSPYGVSNVLYRIGKQYDKLKVADSAAYYYDRALEQLPDRNNVVYRDIVSSWALLDYEWHHDALSALDSLKNMVAQAANETERLIRFPAIGNIYIDIGQYDSAKVYLEPVMEKNAKREIIAARYLRDIALSEGDTVKANQYAIILAQEGATAANNQARVSKLNDLFQNYLQEKQETALALERQEAQQRLLRGVVTAVLVLLVLGLGLWWWMAKRRKEHEAETQTLNEEKQQLQTQVDDALQQLQTVDDALQQLQTQADDALQQARTMLPQRVADLYRAKVPNRLERIMAEFEAAYPGAMERVAAAYPNLTKTETQLFVLSFLQFRAKEEADLLGLSQNTVLQYRSNLRKKTENASISSFLEA
ncbi:MAG: hypothetical protein II829_04160 [Bacteroidales bacterium]|nr:hypothetical protein [Bacteroidales bacterium]